MKQFLKNKKGSLVDTAIGIGLGLTVLFLLGSTIILPRFNEAYNTSVTGLSASTTQGLLLIVLAIGLIGVAQRFYKKS